eukprot:gene20312-4105_t
MQDRDATDAVKHFFTEVYDLYLKVLLNPFYEVNTRITTPAFKQRQPATSTYTHVDPAAAGRTCAGPIAPANGPIGGRRHTEINIPHYIDISGCGGVGSIPCQVRCKHSSNWVGKDGGDGLGEISCPLGATMVQGHFPECEQCEKGKHCSGHADHIWATAEGCQCQCAGGFAGSSCGECLPNYGGYPNCALDCALATQCEKCADGYAGCPPSPPTPSLGH